MIREAACGLVAWYMMKTRLMKPELFSLFHTVWSLMSFLPFRGIFSTINGYLLCSDRFCLLYQTEVEWSCQGLQSSTVAIAKQQQQQHILLRQENMGTIQTPTTKTQTGRVVMELPFALLKTLKNPFLFPKKHYRECKARSFYTSDFNTTSCIQQKKVLQAVLSTIIVDLYIQICFT